MINLKIVKIEDYILKEKNIKPYIFERLYVTIMYKRKSGDFLIIDSVVDTGAIVSILPRKIWKQLDIKFMGYHTIKGIVKKLNCTIPVKIGFVQCKLIDENKNTTPEFKTLVFCADSDEVPIIFGIKHALDKFKLNLDIKNNKAYFE